MTFEPKPNRLEKLLFVFISDRLWLCSCSGYLTNVRHRCFFPCRGGGAPLLLQVHTDLPALN